jgi:hypothetical protein
MKHSHRLALLACLLIPISLSGQERLPGSHTRYGFTLGVAFYQARDQVLNRLRHQGPSISAGVFREGSSEGSVHRIRVSFAFAPLSDRYSPDRSSLLFRPAIEVRYGRKAAQITENVALFMGGRAGWNTDFSFYENWDQGHAYWLTSAHLGFAGTLVRTLADGSSLHLELDAPVLAAVSRPPERFEYKEVKPDFGWIFGHIHEGMRVTSLHEHTALKASLVYHRKGGGFLRQRFFWQTAFTSTRLPDSRPLTTLTHTLGVSHPF